MVKQLTAIIEKEEDGYVALCPEVDVASQGDTVKSTSESSPNIEFCDRWKNDEFEIKGQGLA
jgi:hypothetical protein